MQKYFQFFFEIIECSLKSLDNKFYFVGLSETRLKINDNSDIFNIPDYTLLSKPRTDKRGGGVGLYVTDKTSFKVRDDLVMNPVTCQYESLFIESVMRDHKIIIGVIYKPPESNTDTHNQTKDFVHSLYTNAFYPSISKPTSVTDHSATLLDNIITNITGYCIKSGVLYNEISDHFPVFNLIQIHSKITKKKYVYIFKRMNSVGWGIAPMGGAKRAPLILANLELCGSIWRSNDSLQHTKDLSTDEYVLI